MRIQVENVSVWTLAYILVFGWSAGVFMTTGYMKMKEKVTIAERATLITSGITGGHDMKSRLSGPRTA